MNDCLTLAPHFIVCAARVKVEVLVSSQRLASVPELPTWAPPPVNAPCTMIAGSLEPPRIAELERMNWKRVSLTMRGPRIDGFRRLDRVLR